MSLCLCGSAFFSTPATAQPPGKDELEIAVDKGLAFLKSMQEKDGSWGDKTGHGPAFTGLAIMAFMSAGHVPGEGPYGATVEKGVRWLVQHQQPDGMFGGAHGHSMYHQGICTLTLGEAAGMGDKNLSRDLKPKLEKAVAVILRAQRTANDHHKGGWRYQVDSNDADVSVSGWQLMALRSARNRGCDVPGQRVQLAIDFFLRCKDPDPKTPGFCYVPGGRSSVGCTGTAILALELSGKQYHHGRDVLQAGSYLLQNPPRWQETYFFYNVYYTSQAMFQLGNNYWKLYRPEMHKTLLPQQNFNGSWIGSDNLGPVYGTSMALLALTVEYRLLPIYQRDEGDDKK